MEKNIDVTNEKISRSGPENERHEGAIALERFARELHLTPGWKKFSIDSPEFKKSSVRVLMHAISPSGQNYVGRTTLNIEKYADYVIWADKQEANEFIERQAREQDWQDAKVVDVWGYL